ncbi:hypothetical protein HYS50_01690 [Candidatus Woesearchaeota archaeon]|nr:hypothetical protein [Candidatus Woesearchaeota archaeon]
MDCLEQHDLEEKLFEEQRRRKINFWSTIAATTLAGMTFITGYLALSTVASSSQEERKDAIIFGVVTCLTALGAYAEYRSTHPRRKNTTPYHNI